MIIKEIKNAAQLAQQLIKNLYDVDPNNETFEQIGILDGEKIVLDWIRDGEWTIALDHLLYMIHESDIRFPRETVHKPHEIAEFSHIKNYYAKENLINLTETQVKNIFNAPWSSNDNDQQR